MKKFSKNSTMGMSIGMCLGISIGLSLGSAFDNTGLGISLGISIGMCLGMAVGAIKDNELNKQLEEQGFRITEIEENSEDYTVTVENKMGEKQTVTVKTKNMISEKFKVGDFVFLDKKGNITKIFDDEDR